MMDQSYRTSSFDCLWICSWRFGVWLGTSNSLYCLHLLQGYRTGYPYKQPVIKREVLREKSNSGVEIPPSSSSFTYVFDGDIEHSKYVWVYCVPSKKRYYLMIIKCHIKINRFTVPLFSVFVKDVINPHCT